MHLSDNRTPITVGELKKALEELPDDMEVVGVDGHSGQEDNILIYTNDEAECSGGREGRTTLVVMLG